MAATKIQTLPAMTKIRITMGAVTVKAKLNDTESAQQIAKALPLRARARTWGKEIYFDISLSLPSENAQDVVKAGDLGYWPEGPALCIFFGATPVSVGNEIRAASPVNLIGRLVGEFDSLHEVRDDDIIMVSRDL